MLYFLNLLSMNVKNGNVAFLISVFLNIYVSCSLGEYLMLNHFNMRYWWLQSCLALILQVLFLAAGHFKLYAARCNGSFINHVFTAGEHEPRPHQTLASAGELQLEPRARPHHWQTSDGQTWQWLTRSCRRAEKMQRHWIGPSVTASASGY